METEHYIDIPTVITNESANGINLIFNKFDYAIHTFQFIGQNQRTGRIHSPVKLYRPSEKERAYTECLKFNNDGYDIYFMVNEGDGLIHEGKKTPRSQANVKTLSKLFIDTDSCPIEKVQTYLSSINLQPHLTIESSPNRFHLYFNIEPIIADKINVSKWQTIQRVLHLLGDVTLKSPSVLGMDATMHDYSKVLRVPGFTHQKKKSRVTVKFEADSSPYALDDVFSLVHAQDYLDYSMLTHGTYTPSHIPDLNAADIIPIGNRFNTLQSLSMHLANTGTSFKSNYVVFSSFINTRLDNSDEIYADTVGNLTDKSKALFNSANKKIQKEEIARVKVMREGAETLNTSHEPAVDADNKKTDLAAWHLPDEFYLNAPNGFGDVVRQVMQHSMYPCASLAFGTFLPALSILKAKTHFSYKGYSPAIYSLNVAPTGWGKTDPATFMKNMFSDLGLGRLVESEIRSDQGFLKHLKQNNGLGLFSIDEVAPFLKYIQHKEAKAYHANISRQLLKLFSTGAVKEESFGQVSDTNTKKGEKETILHYPMVAIAGYTTPEEFKTMFTVESVTKGLFQRFISFVVPIVDILPNKESNAHAIIKSELFSIPAKAFLDASELTEDGERIATLQAESIQRQQMRCSPEAEKKFYEMQCHYRALQTKLAQDPEQAPLSGACSRIVEYCDRLATVLSIDEITLSTLDYVHTLVEKQYRATLAIMETRGAGSKNVEDIEKLVAAYRRLSDATGSKIVFQREIYMRMRRQFPSGKEFKSVFADTIDAGILIPVPNYRRNPASRSGLGVTLAPDE